MCATAANAATNARPRTETSCAALFSCDLAAHLTHLTELPIRPCDQIAQRGPAIVAPGQRRLLHLAQPANPGHSPMRQLLRQRRLPVFGRGKAHSRYLAPHALGALHCLRHVLHALDIDEAVEARELKARVGLDRKSTRLNS